MVEGQLDRYSPGKGAQYSTQAAQSTRGRRSDKARAAKIQQEEGADARIIEQEE